MKKSISRIIGVIMLIVAIVFIMFALNHPEKSFPWISYGKATYLLEEGDSIYYDSIVPHHVHAYEGQAAKILAVVYTPI